MTGYRCRYVRRLANASRCLIFEIILYRYGDDIVVLDKSGRLQRFSKDGKFLDVVAQIDAYLGNGFIIEGEQAVIACSGIVLNRVSFTVFFSL